MIRAVSTLQERGARRLYSSREGRPASLLLKRGAPGVSFLSERGAPVHFERLGLEAGLEEEPRELWLREVVRPRPILAHVEILAQLRPNARAQLRPKLPAPPPPKGTLLGGGGRPCAHAAPPFAAGPCRTALSGEGRRQGGRVAGGDSVSDPPPSHPRGVPRPQGRPKMVRNKRLQLRTRGGDCGEGREEVT